MTLGTVKRAWAGFCINRLLVGTRCFDAKRRLLNWIGHEIDEGTKIVGPVFCTGKLKVGSNCWLGRNLTVHGNGLVEIGDNCDIAPDVMFLTGGHEIGDQTRRAGKGETYSISVGNGTWIGARATISGETKIGSSCVVAACACVVSDIGDNTLVGGVPAKTIRELSDEY